MQLFEAAVNAGIISKELASVYHELRILRNSAVHKDAPISRDDSDDAMEKARIIVAAMRREWMDESEEAQ